MEVLLWSIGSPVLYLFTGLTAYRSQYKRTYREFLIWRNSEPDTKHRLVRGYSVYDPPPRDEPRKVFSYHNYMMSVSDRWSPSSFVLGWLPIVLFTGLYKYMRPEVETPDEVKVKELERDLKKYDSLPELNA